METQQKELLLKLIAKRDYFTKLKPGHDHSLEATIKVASYNELNLMVASLLKTSISILKNEVSGLSDSNEIIEIDVINLLEIALQLLPESEMELLDEVCGVGK